MSSVRIPAKRQKQCTTMLQLLPRLSLAPPSNAILSPPSLKVLSLSLTLHLMLVIVTLCFLVFQDTCWWGIRVTCGQISLHYSGWVSPNVTLLHKTQVTRGPLSNSLVSIALDHKLALSTKTNLSNFRIPRLFLQEDVPLDHQLWLWNSGRQSPAPASSMASNVAIHSQC